MTTARAAFPLALVLVLAAASGARAEDSRFDPHHVVAPPLRPVRVVTPERFVLPDGAVVFLLEDHTLPVVSGTAYFPASPLLVPDDRVGLADVTGEVMRTGGSATHPGDALDDRLAAIGASLSSWLSDDLGYGGFRCLTDNTAEVVGLFAEVLRKPAFPDDKIELSKVGLRRGIASRNDEMLELLNRVADRAAHGAGSPWVRIPEYATIEPISRADCVRLHGQVFVPDRMVIAVFGDFRAAEMKRLLTRAFADWKRSGTPAPALPTAEVIPPARLLFAPKSDVTQTGIILTHLGSRADDPDYAALQVYENALGGGFSSRLVNHIRTQRGLAYAVGADAGIRYRRPGVFRAYALTRNDSAMTALELLREEVALSVREPFTDSEFAVARDAVQNNLVFEFEKPSAVLFRAAFYQVLGYPADFLARYQQGLGAVTSQSMSAAVRRKVHPEALSAVVVGKEGDFERPLAAAGLPVERVDISIPPPPSKLGAGAVTPEALARGRALLERAANAAGGVAAWAAVKGITTSRSLTVSVEGQQMRVADSTIWMLPDHHYELQRLPMGEIVQGCDGASGWAAAMGQVQDQPQLPEQVAKEYERSLFRLYGHPDAVAAQVLPEPQTIDGVRYDVALAKSERLRDWTLFFGPTGGLDRMEFGDQGPLGGPARITVVFDDWQPLGALRFPRTQSMLVDGKAFMEAKLVHVELDPVVPDEVFRKPSH